MKWLQRMARIKTEKRIRSFPMKITKPNGRRFQGRVAKG